MGGRWHAHLVDHFPGIFGDPVIQVVHDPRLRAVQLHLQIERNVHVHRNSFNASAPLSTEPLEERANRFSAAPFDDPQGGHDGTGCVGLKQLFP